MDYYVAPATALSEQFRVDVDVAVGIADDSLSISSATVKSHIPNDVDLPCTGTVWKGSIGNSYTLCWAKSSGSWTWSSYSKEGRGGEKDCRGELLG